MGAKTLVFKGMITKILAGGIGFAVIHAILFWIAYFKCGGAHDSAKGIWQGITSAGSAWADMVKWLGFPLSGIDASGAAFVIVMIVNSILWGAVIGVIVGLIFGRKA